MPEVKAIPVPIEVPSTSEDSLLRERIASYLTQEIVIGVVGYAGSGTTFTVEKFARILEEEGFTPHIIKARKILESWSEHKGHQSPKEIEDVTEKVTAYQNLGDDLRQSSEEFGAVAGWMAKEVHKVRQGKGENETQVFFLDSLKHPAEVELLRQIYGEGFRLIGVGCRPDIRQRRLEIKFHAPEDDEITRDLIDRDAEDSVNKYGQQVNKTFHLSDYFVDNTISAELTEDFKLPDTLKEVFEKLFSLKTYHPSRDEQGLYFADAAATGSACLSRQVGAAIVDESGNLLSVGRNDVPKASGGLYDSDNDDNEEGRCFLRGECSNKVYQHQIADDIVRIFDDADMPDLGDKVEYFKKALTKTRMGALIEFSRSVHAEMDALVSLSRTGTKLPGNSTLFTTTYPCHNCARHIIASGIKRVVYLEPYKKSLAIDLHDDAIADNLPDSETGDRVRFEPYVGVAPRLYQAVYRQNGERKDDSGTALVEETGRTLRSRLSTKSFNELETECERFFTEQGDE
jgi:deoxycytidylate deaminase